MTVLVSPWTRQALSPALSAQDFDCLSLLCVGRRGDINPM